MQQTALGLIGEARMHDTDIQHGAFSGGIDEGNNAHPCPQQNALVKAKEH